MATRGCPCRRYTAVIWWQASPQPVDKQRQRKDMDGVRHTFDPQQVDTTEVELLPGIFTRKSEFRVGGEFRLHVDWSTWSKQEDVVVLRAARGRLGGILGQATAELQPQVLNHLLHASCVHNCRSAISATIAMKTDDSTLIKSTAVLA